MLLTAILAFGHVFGAIAWLGGGVLFGFFVAPKFQNLSPATLREFLIKVVPGVSRFFEAAAGVTIVFGLLLLANMVDGNYAQFSPPTGWALDISIGMAFAIVAFVLSVGVAAPRLKELVKIAQSTPENPTSLPPEFPRAAMQVGQISIVLLVLLMITLALMVTAGFY